MKKIHFILAALTILTPATLKADDSDDHWSFYYYFNLPFDLEDKIADDEADTEEPEGLTDKKDMYWNGKVGIQYKGNRKDYSKAHYPSFYMGPNMLCEQYGVSSIDAIPQRNGKSWELGWYLADDEIHLSRNICLSTALAISRSRYQFSEGRYLVWSTASGSHGLDWGQQEEYCKQGYMRYWSLRIPLSLDLEFSSGAFFTIGPELEYRFGGISKVKKIGGGKETLTKDLDLNPLAANLLLQLGIKDCGIMLRYSMTELFKHQSPAEAYPFTLGFSICY